MRARAALSRASWEAAIFLDVSALSTEPTVSELKEKLHEEEEFYAELLAKLDALSGTRAPYDQDGTIPELLASLNQSSALTAPDSGATTDGAEGGGLKGLARAIARRLVEPELQALGRALKQQRSFNSSLVQFLNRFAETSNRAAAAQAEFTSALVGFSQRIDRLADAKDRLYACLGNERADLLLQAMDQRVERVQLGVRAIKQRVEGMDSSLAVARAELHAVFARVSGESPARAESTPDLEAEHYLAFEERFRGSSDAIRERLADYVPYFEGKNPVLELGCGRGEFLELLKEAGIEAEGVDGNREMIHACRDKGVEAKVGDLVTVLADRAAGSAGGIFAAQVIEHLPPSLLRKVLADGYRVLRPKGRIILETVNPTSVIALVESFYRDLTHQKPLHPETLEFMLRAVGFPEVTVRTTSPVGERARLLPVMASMDGSDTVNQNFEKLNALLFADQDYAVIATK